MNIAIVEDTQVGIEILRNLLFEYAAANGVSLDVDCFVSAEDFLRNYHSFRYTLIFMDIYMGGMDGIEAAERLRETDSATLIVFLTASSSHMPQAFNVHAYDYIRKPIDPVRLYRLMDEIRGMQGRKSNESELSFVCSRKEYSLPFSDIVSITVSGNYLEVTAKDGKVYSPRMTFSAACDRLAKDTRFLMVLRGVLVNMDEIESFSEHSCCLRNGSELPINVKSAKKIRQIWMNYSFARRRSDSIQWGM